MPSGGEQNSLVHQSAEWHDDAGSRDIKDSLHDMMRIVRRGKWTILLILLLVLSGVGGYLAVAEPEYQSYTLLKIGEQSSEGQDALQSGMVNALGPGDRTLANQVLILEQSMAIAEATIERLRSAEDTGTGPLTVLAVQDGEPTTTERLALLLHEEYLDVRVEGDNLTDAIRIAATSTNPDEAALIANFYAAEYMQRVREMSRRRIKAARLFLEQQLDKRDAELKSAEYQIEQYRDDKSAVALDAEAALAIERIANLEVRLDEARVELMTHRASLQKAEEELEEVRPKLIERVASTAKEEIEQLQKTINDLELRTEQIYLRNPDLRDDPDQNGDLRQLNDRIAQLKYRVNSLSEDYVEQVMAVGGSDPLRSDAGEGTAYVAQLNRRIASERIALSGAQARIAALEQRLAQYDYELRTLPEHSTRLAQLSRAQTSAAEGYKQLEARLQEVRMAEEAEIGMAEVIRPALVPLMPIRPNWKWSLLLGTLLGLSLGLLVAVIRYKLDTRIYTPEDLRTHRFGVLGVVPDGSRIVPADGRRKRLGRGRGASGNGALLPAASDASPLLSEAYRRLHLSVVYSRPDKIVRTIMVTSSEPGAGKSTTALNLATTVARTGRRTLLVDADLRKPQLAKLLGQSSGPSLSDLLLSNDLDTRHLATSIENVFAVTVREPVKDVDMVLSSSRMRDLLAKMEAQFDLIIFDTPPVLAVADAVFLGEQCDATVVVASAGHTEAEALRQTIEELQDAKATVVGTVLNRFDPTEASGYAGYTYHYYEEYTSN